MRKHEPPRHERGAALLAVLLLVAVIGALCAAALEKMRLSTALAVNSSGLDQARAFAGGLESLATLALDDLVLRSPDRTVIPPALNGVVRKFPLPGGGQGEMAVTDGGNCFNINSVVEQLGPNATVRREAGVNQFVGLMRILGIPESSGRAVAEAAADWADSDAQPGPMGAEDSQYRGAATPYRTGNTLFAEVSELRTLTGVTPEIYTRLRPWICALPSSELSPLNLNSLTPEQAPLLSMLAPDQLPLDRARQILLSRPEGGWGSTTEFWSSPSLSKPLPPLDVQLQPQLRTRWFSLALKVEARGTEMSETALVDARVIPSRVAMRQAGDSD